MLLKIKLAKWSEQIRFCDIGMAIVMSFFVLSCTTLPPKSIDTPLTQARVEHREGRDWLGKNWLGNEGGLPVLYLTGTAFEMGYANGVLTQKALHRHEDALLNAFQSKVPGAWRRYLIRKYIMFKTRNLGKYIREEHQQEMLGASQGCPDTHPELESQYRRIMLYHASEEMLRQFTAKPTVGGCTTFGAGPGVTADGHLICARNFDLPIMKSMDGASMLDEIRLVVICQPDVGIPFVSVAWAGMVGSVSGMNQAGISVVVNAAPSLLPKGGGTPSCLVARQILQHARTMEEAIAIVRDSVPLGSGLYIIGSATDGRFVVVERTREKISVREETNGYVVCANHFVDAGQGKYAKDMNFPVDETSAPRFARAEQLVSQVTGHLDPATAVNILRDSHLSDGRFVGFGHLNALCGYITAHAVTMDLTTRTLWVSKPPHQLGAFIPFDVGNLRAASAGQTLPADARLASGAFARHQEAEKALKVGRLALSNNDFDNALVLSLKAEELNPGFYGNTWLTGKAWLSKGGPSITNALPFLLESLKRSPPYQHETLTIRAEVEQAQALRSGK